jgi:2-polyprenyl-3-methyl-5-hydroxy-6-metoxy-1,4-benzoquinol methylase
LLLSLSSARRRITGIDCEKERIKLAEEQARSAGINNCVFLAGDIINCDYQGIYDCILLVDVLYQLAAEEKIKVIERCRNALAFDGVLIVKEMNGRPFWKLIWCRIQEAFLARPLMLNKKRINLSDPDELTGIFRNAGFKVDAARIDKGYAYPHILFICHKQAK